MTPPLVTASPAAAERAAPSVSVVIPTYGHRDFVLATLASVWAQTFQDFEVIVVNDGSPDDTGALLAPLAASGRIRYVEQSNQGQAAARNRGIAQARGAFIALLDDDDLWPADKLEWQVRALHEHPDVAVVYGRVHPIGDVGETLDRVEEKFWQRTDGPGGNVYQDFLNGNQIVSPGQTLIRRSALDGLADAPFDPTIWGNDDWDLWLRLAENCLFLFQPSTALHYRLHANNASRDLVRMFLNATAMYEKHLRRYPDGSEDRERVAAAHARLRGFLPNLLLAQARQDRQRGDARTALAKMTWLIGLFPAALADSSAIRFYLDTYQEVAPQDREAVCDVREQRDLFHAQLEQLQTRLERVQARREAYAEQVKQLEGRIATMQGSGFWKLRKRWFRLKRVAGVTGDHE